MNTWSAHLLLAKKYLLHVFDLEIISMWQCVEIALGLLMVTILFYLMLESSKYERAVRNYACPNSIQFKTEHQDGLHDSDMSIGYQEYRARRKLRPCTLSKLSWTTEERNKFVDILNGRLEVMKGSPEHDRYAEQLLSLSPSQFVRLDKEEQKRKVACALSLSTLYRNVKEKRFSDEELLKQLEAAKEECQYSAYAREIMDYVKAENVTDSLIDLLQEFIDNSSVDNPPPMSEFTSMVYDVGNFNIKPLKKLQM